MSKKNILKNLLIAAGLLIAGGADAFLPPDAEAWESRIKADRRRIEAEFQAHQAARLEEAVRVREHVLAEMDVPPWIRPLPPEEREAALAEAAQTKGSPVLAKLERKNGILFPVLSLILIAAAVFWVRHATREVDA